MTQRIRANVSVRANSAAIRSDTLEGRAVLIVPSVTLPDDIVMNGLRYPAAEIAKAFHTLERTPAPLGHPMLNGEMVSASDPEAMNIFSIGAFNRNVRRIDGRVHLEKVIDVAVAEASEGGRRVLKAIAEGLPIHTSTGLIGTIHETDDGPEIRDLIFDHDAILLDEPGAATPADGVGMLVNSDDGAETRLPVRTFSIPQPQGDTDVNQEDFNGLIEAALAPLEATIAALAEDLAALKAKAAEAAESERAELANQAVAEGLLTNHTANEASTSILKALLTNGKKAFAAPTFRSALNADHDLDGYNLNEALTPLTNQETPIHA